MVFLLFKNNEFITVYNTLDLILNYLYNQIKTMILCNNTNIISYINNYYILEYDNGLQLNKFKFDSNNIKFYDDNGHYYDTNNNYLKNYRIELLTTLTSVEILSKKINKKNDMDVCLNINVEDLNELNNLTEDINMGCFINNEKQLLENIKKNNKKQINDDKQKKLDEIKQKLDLEQQKLELMKIKYDHQEKKYIDEKQNIENFKLKLKNDHNAMNEFKRKFYSDKNIYFILKQEIIDNKRNKDDIPPLFIREFFIFNLMNEQNLFNNQDELKEYIKLLDEYNTKYDNDDNKFNDDNNSYYNKIYNKDVIEDDEDEEDEEYKEEKNEE